MFNMEDHNSIDRGYFNMIAINEYDVTVISRNTGHYWYMHNPEYPRARHNHLVSSLFRIPALPLPEAGEEPAKIRVRR